MKLNLPIWDTIESAQQILVAGAGGGFDVFCGLPIYFALKAAGKSVHLANLSFTPFGLIPIFNPEAIELSASRHVLGVKGRVERDTSYFPEGYLAQWFHEQGEEVVVWTYEKMGVQPVREAYQAVVNHLGIDAIILVDGGVDSLMRGNESGAGTLVEDSVSLTAVSSLDVPVKILAAIGFGAEVEEAVCHYNALENMADLMAAGACLGSCSLVKQMSAFQAYETAARYVFEQPGHVRSRISTRIIPAVHGGFGDVRMYDEGDSRVLLSPLTSIYWFFDAMAVSERSVIRSALETTVTMSDAFSVVLSRHHLTSLRPTRQLPY